MVLLDLLHIQRAGFFTFLKQGISEELYQLNISVGNTHLQLVSFDSSLTHHKYSSLNLLQKKYATTQSLDVPEVLGLKPSSLTLQDAQRFVVPRQTKNYKIKVCDGSISSCSCSKENLATSLSFGCLTSFSNPCLASLSNGINNTNYTKGLLAPRVRVRARAQDKPLVVASKAFHYLSTKRAKLAVWKMCTSCNKLRRCTDKQNRFVSPEASSIMKDKANTQWTQDNEFCHPKGAGLCFRLLAPKGTPREAILHQRSWSSKLIVKVLLKVTGPLVKPTSKQGSALSSVNNNRVVQGQARAQDSGSHAELRYPLVQPVTAKQGKEAKNNNILKPIYRHMRLHSSLPCLKDKLEAKQNNSTHELFLALGELPLMTRRGHFIIHGSPRVVLSQLVRTPGLYFVERNHELQADCVPEQGPWLSIQRGTSRGQLKPNIPHKDEGDVSLVQVKQPVHNSTRALSPRVSASLMQETKKLTSLIQNQREPETLASFSPTVSSTVVRSKRSNAWSEGPRGVQYFCYTKQFSSLPFSLVYSQFRIFELHDQFTDQTLLLIKLKTLEKIKQLREVIATLLSLNSRGNDKKKLKKLYVRRCLTATQQFERTKTILRLKRKLKLGYLGRRGFHERLGTITLELLPPLLSAQQKLNLGSSKLKVNHHSWFEKQKMEQEPAIKTTLLKKHNYTETYNHTRAASYTALHSEDLARIISLLNGSKALRRDDIDDLSNQRVRTPSEQIQQQLHMGCFRFKKMFLRLSAESWSISQTITDLLNGSMREFFGGNPLSQFLDQTNPLAEITHKRRISKLGLGGIQRESATLKVRTIHSTYFGRICPIETPEGINAGLINSLTCLSRVNEQGQLITPLSLVAHRQVQDQMYCYSSREKENISTTDTPLLRFQRLPNQFVATKNESNFEFQEAKMIRLRVQSLSTISLATALIPFLSYDDANRALMGSNMQRQAVPLIEPERPLIRTGLEPLVLAESGHGLESPRAGLISYISGRTIAISWSCVNRA